MIERFKSPIFYDSSTWQANVKGGVWELGQYRSCYLTIRRLDNNMYMPLMGATKAFSWPGNELPAKGYFEFDILEQAKQCLYDHVDYIRDVRDAESIILLHERLHTAMPNVHLKV